MAIGFNASAVLAQAGLSGRVVAGNFFNVTNSGPVATPTNGTNTNINSGNGTTTGGGGRSSGGAGETGGTDGVRNGNGTGFNQGNVTTAGAARLGSSEFGGIGMMVATYGAVALGAVAFTSLFL